MGSEAEFIIEKGVLNKYAGDAEKVIIPEGVHTIASDAFFEYKNFREVVFPSTIKKICAGVFVYCSGLRAVIMPVECPDLESIETPRVYMSKPVFSNYANTKISFREKDGKIAARIVVALKDESDSKRNKISLAIKSKDGKFDFESYDSNFAVVSKTPNKVLMALYRVAYDYQISADMYETYLAYLKKQGAAAGMILIDEDDIETLELLGKKKVFNANTTKKLIDYASSKNKAAISAWLLEYNNRTFGKSLPAKSELTLSAAKTVSDNTSEELSMKVSEWRKIFKFKYSGGGVVITEYIGNDECVTIPKKIGNKYVIGIGRAAFNFNLSKNVKKIIIPKWISSIESQAFLGTSDVDIEIQEGLTELPANTFLAVQNLTIKLPRSLTHIEEQFSDSYEETIKLVVSKDSYAEDFVKNIN